MAEHCRFFNSTETDIREYLASEFAEYFGLFIPDGVHIDNGELGLGVIPETGLSVSLGPGYAHIRGYLYKNDAPIVFNLDEADDLLDRIDRVAIKLDIVNRTINAVLKKGTLGSSPVPPPLINETSIKEIAIAQIKVNHNTVSISASHITDERTLIPSLKEIGARFFTGEAEPQTIRVGDIWLQEV